MGYVSRTQNEGITGYMSIENATAKKPDFMQAYTAIDSNTTNGIVEVISKMVITSPAKVLNKIKYNIPLYFVAVLEILGYIELYKKYFTCENGIRS